MTTELLNIERIRTDGGTQSRAGLNEKTLADYVDDLRNGEQFPPVDVVYDGQHYWLYDGYHRHEAHRRAGRTHISATVHQGDQAEAQWRSYAANPAHGLRRTQEDKERAIKAALRHPKAAGLSDSSLAKYLRVSDKTVTKYRRELEVTGEIAAQSVRTGADGRTINTANIGARRESVESARKPVESDPSDLLMPIVAEWLRGYRDNLQRTWRDMKGILTLTHAKPYIDLLGHVHARGFRTDNIALINAINTAFAHLEQAEADQIDERIYRLQTWLIGKGWGIGANSISDRHQSFTWSDNDPRAHLAALKRAEAIQKEKHTQHDQPPPTSEDPKSAEPPSITSIASDAPGPSIPAYLADAGCKIQSMGNGEYKIYIPIGLDSPDSLTVTGPVPGLHAAIIVMDEQARGRGLLPDKAIALSPQPAPPAGRAITETLDEAIRRAVCVYAGDREKWQALAASGADYWQISDLLKACINSTGGSGGPGCYWVEVKRGPIVTIAKGVGGPVVAKLIAGSLISAVRTAWSIPEPRVAQTRSMVAPAGQPLVETIGTTDESATDIERLVQARRLHSAIAALLDIIDDYGAITGNQDAAPAAVRVLQPMLNRLEMLLAPEEALPAF